MISPSSTQSTVSASPSYSSSSSSSSSNYSATQSIMSEGQQEQQGDGFARRPLAGSSTRRIEDNNHLEEVGKDESIVHQDTQHASFSDGDDGDESSFSSGGEIAWKRIPGRTIHVRSANYIRDKVKVPSPGELYECVYVDFLESAERIPNVSSRVHIPTDETRRRDDDEVDDRGNDRTVRKYPWHAPDVFVLSLSLPVAPYVLKKDGKGGPSYTISMYFRMKHETRDILKRMYAQGNDDDHDHDDHDSKGNRAGGDNVDGSRQTQYNPLHNAVRLFDQWCHRSLLDDKQFMGRFKLITSIGNFETLGIPKYISCWNGKPVLIKRPGTTGFLYQNNNPHCMEMEISFHPFPWATKKAIRYLCDNALPSALLNFGFVIEARDETELPEVLIGLCQLCYPRAERAMPSDQFFNKVPADE